MNLPLLAFVALVAICGVLMGFLTAKWECATDDVEAEARRQDG